MAFDVDGARKAGYSDAEIANHLASSAKFDLAGARKAGYSDAEILDHLKPSAQKDAESPKGTGSAILDGANAVGSGFMRGVTRLAGLPVDTVANVRDLGKAAIGAPYTAITGKPAPEWLQISDRANDIGSGENLIGAARKTSIGKAIVDPANPSYEGGYLQNAGAALSSINNPKTLLQAGNQFALGQVGAATGKATADATGNPALAVAASLAPAGAQNLITGGVKRAVRGGEEGRQAMVQRMQDLKNAGIEEPTLGLASGNKKLGAAENLLQGTPGAVGVMGAARDKAVAGLASKAVEAADAAAPVRGADVAGNAIKKDITQTFMDRFKGTQGALYDKLGNLIPANTPIDVSSTEATLGKLTSSTPGAEQTTQALVNNKIRGIKQGFDVDVGTVSAVPEQHGVTQARSVQLVNDPFLGVGGSRTPLQTRVSLPEQTYTTPGSPAKVVKSTLMGEPQVTPAVPAQERSIPARTVIGFSPFSAAGVYEPEIKSINLPEQSYTVRTTARRKSPLSMGVGNMPLLPPELPYGAVKGLRTRVGDELSGASLAPDVPTAQWKQLYAGLSNDMRGAATAAGPQAEQAFGRANDYTKAGLARLDRVSSFANADAPEKAYTSLIDATRENNTTLRAVKKTVTPETRATVAGTVIDRLGRANPVNQSDLGDVFSQERFLTNWNTMTPKARDELFSGFKNSDQVKADVEAIAKGASMMRDSSKMYANPSGSGANITARRLIGAVGGGGAAAAAGLLNPLIPLGAAAGLGGLNLLGRGLTSQKVLRSMAEQNYLSPELQDAQIRSLIGAGRLSDQRK